jgi:hypothetical protein
MYVSVPFVGANELNCTIRKKNSNDDVTKTSPYSCTVSWGDPDPHSIDPQPHWTVQAKPVTTVDATTATPGAVAAAQKDILDTCGLGLGTCKADTTNQTIFQVPQGPGWTIIGKPYVNGTNKPVPYEYDDGWKLSWKDTFKVGADYDFSKTFPLVGLKISADYSHTWASEADSHLKYRMDVDPNHIGIFYLQPGYLAVTGNFTISFPDKVEFVKNITVNYPLSGPYYPNGDIQKAIPPGVVIACNLPAGASTAPPASGNVCPGGKLSVAQPIS